MNLQAYEVRTSNYNNEEKETQTHNLTKKSVMYKNSPVLNLMLCRKCFVQNLKYFKKKNSKSFQLRKLQDYLF